MALELYRIEGLANRPASEGEKGAMMAFQTTEGLLKDATETDLNAAGGSVHFIWRPFLEEHGSVECYHSKSVAEKDNYLERLSFLQGLIGDRYLDGEGPYSSTQGA